MTRKHPSDVSNWWMTAIHLKMKEMSNLGLRESTLRISLLAHMIHTRELLLGYSKSYVYRILGYYAVLSWAWERNPFMVSNLNGNCQSRYLRTLWELFLFVSCLFPTLFPILFRLATWACCGNSFYSSPVNSPLLPSESDSSTVFFLSGQAFCTIWSFLDYRLQDQLHPCAIAFASHEIWKV